MTLIDRFGGGLPRAPVTVDLDDIQATVLRYRPEPYYGTHVMLHVTDARAGREFVRQADSSRRLGRRLVAGGRSWVSVAISYSGLVALGVPQDSLESFPEAFRAGMAARAGQLRDDGDNDPEALGRAVRQRAGPHRGQRLQRLRSRRGASTMEMARQQYRDFPA